MKRSMKEHISNLLALQAVDDEIDQLNADGGNLPDVIEQMDIESEKRKKDLEEKKEKLEASKLRKRKASHERESTYSALKKYESQLSLVKTNKEYEALLHEIDHAEFRILELDEEAEKLKKEIEELEKVIEDTEKRFQEEEEKYQKQREILKEKLDTLEENLEVKFDERKRVKVRLPRRISSEYERIRKGTKGKVVVPVVDGSCGGCYYTLPPQMVYDARKQDRLLHCESCGRLVVWVEED